VKGIPARVEGREIGSGLKVLAKRWKPKNFDMLLKRLDDYQEREITKYRAAERETQAAAVEDRVTCLKVIIERVMSQKTNKPPVQAVCDEIDRIFGVDDNDRRPMVILSSIHKAKGREFDKVYWLQTGGSKFARKAWEHEAEVNLCYVAVTRAKKTLVLVAMPKKES
jgi:superfamily I DNA/RNA helicase